MTALALARPLSELKAAALKRIDAEAAAARSLYLTDAAGQELEYQQTEAEARAYKAADYPVPFDAAAQALYPMIWAEVQAQADNGVLLIGTQAQINFSARLVTDEVVSLANAWNNASPQIKRIRRRAKIAIEAATTPAQIRTILETASAAWPSP